MNPDTATYIPHSSKSEIWGYRMLVAAVFLAQLVFLPTNFIALDLVKTTVIVCAIAISAVLCAWTAWKERKMSVMPGIISWPAVVVVLSAILSAIAVRPMSQAFFGQGFEIDTVGFIIILFVAMRLSYAYVVRQPDRAVGLFAAVVMPFFILEAFHALRFIFGSGFATLGILQSLTSTVLGSWYSLTLYGAIVSIISISALVFLPLSRGMKAGYGIAAAAGFVGALLVNDVRVWGAGALVFLGLAAYAALSRPRGEGNMVRAWASRISWLPVAAFVVFAILAFRSGTIAGPVISAINGGYSEIQLPWQQTLDVGAGAIKDSPITGSGPNRFVKSYIAHKPALVNQTDAWSVEFTSGFGLIPTFFVTQGLIGIIAWIIFFVFFGIAGARAFKRMPADPRARFVIVSSYAVSLLLWLMLLISLQPHAIVLLAFVMSGIFVGASVSYGALSGRTSAFEGRTGMYARYSVGAAAIVIALIGIVYAKDAVALSYFGAGAKALSGGANPSIADRDFATALSLENSDVFWQARVEAGIAAAQKIIASVSSSSSASTTQAAASSVTAIINTSLGYSDKAIAYDPSNYYNYISKARISTLAASINMANAYDVAVSSYAQAIRLDQQNPSIYLSLAQLQAQTNHLPDALQTLGAALQVKSNYLDAVYLLSQVEAAQGNVKDAITAANVAIQINPQSPLLYFQLGLLEYNAADYAAAATALEKAINIQADYSNARYFLGLSYARLNRTADAVDQFAQLSATNPDNQTVQSILTALRSGKSIFTPASAPAAGAAKAPKLPLKQKGQ